ncbi:MAG: Crp/Fnr family transcriptional regulator [Cyclobacteriaceae bacterium]
MEDKIWYLKQINILKSLSRDELMNLGAQCAMQQFKAGDKISFRESDPTVYFLKVGTVKIMDREQTLIELIEAGEIFGFLFTGDSSDGVSIYAQQDCIVCYLAADRWKAVLGKNRNLSYQLFKWAGLRINRIERRLDSLFFKSMEERVHSTFVDLMNRFGRQRTNEWTSVSLKINQQQLAQLTGTSRQNVNSILNKWKANGLIDFNRSGFSFSPDFRSLLIST